ncbi:MAG TPA: hypothetical protein VMI11_02840 [Actinomycetes bacterium]|nr:hypothetical protein [Actinomycetes bacterium]
MPPLPHDLIDATAAEQAGVLSRHQLRELGVSADAVAWAVRARRWRIVGRAVVVHRGPLTREARWWIALIHVGPGSALAAWTAAEAAGLEGFERQSVHVVVPIGYHHTRRMLPWIKLHVSRRFTPSDIVRSGGPARVSVARAVIDAGAWAATARGGCAVVVGAIQQRLTTPELVYAELGRAGQVRRRRLLAATLVDVAGGSQAMTEIDVAKLCRRFGLPLPYRQAVRVDSRGKRRYLDAWWRRADGRIVHLEIDGAVHLSVLRMWDDLDRQSDLAISEDALAIRVAGIAARLDPAGVARRIAAALRIPFAEAA